MELKQVQEAAAKKHAAWERFIAATSVEIEEPEPGRFTYYIRRPKLEWGMDGVISILTWTEFEDDKRERGSFSSREAALASGNAVIALMHPEPQV
jgi:hypothetical protein